MGRISAGVLGTVLLLWSSLLLFAFSGRMYTTDVLGQYEVASSLTGERPLLTVSGEFGWIVHGTRPGNYIPHGIGFSILLVPAALVGRLAGLLGGKISVALINSVLSLLLVGFWYASARKRFGSDVPVSRFILVALGGMTLVYGKMTFDVTAAAAALMAAYFFYGSERTLIAGACLGMAILIRLDSLLFLPLFIGDWKRMRQLALSVLPFILLIVLANWYRFGNPLSDGHGQDPAIAVQPFRGGIPGLLLSPGKGLLYYAPLCILALFHQKDWKLLAPFVLSLVFHGMLHDWTGGTGWGPRFLFTSLPFLLLPLCKRGAGGKLFWPVAVLGGFITLLAVWSNPSVIEQAAGADLFDTGSRQAVIWSYSSSPVFGVLREFGRGTPDVIGAYAASEAGYPAWTGVLAQWLAAIALGVFAIWRSRWRQLREGAAA